MTRYIEDLNENTAPGAGDYLLCYDASAGSTDKDRKVNISKFAVLANANTFSNTQTMGPSTVSVIPLVVNSPTSASVVALDFQQATTPYARFFPPALSENSLLIATRDMSALRGPGIAIGRNSNGSTPAAGRLILTARDDTSYRIWPDVSGNLRIWGAGDPTYANDASGTVVGAQTSSLDSKDVIGEFTNYDGALAAILATPLHDFKYKSGAYNGERFTGIITDYAPIFGMDRDKEHPAGKSLNDITGFGYTIAALKAVVRRLIEVERKLA